MERDFLGLNLKDSVIVVKEEAVEGFKDSGLVKSSGVPWPLSNKVSALAPFVPFKTSHDEKMPKVNSDHLASSGYMVMSSADAFDIKRQSGEAQNLAGASLKQQFIGGVPVAAPCSFLASSSFAAGTTEPWFSTKASGGAPQLTIFYGGTVNVFDDITPEKAQAIMLLAGNACNMAQTRLPVQPPASKFASGDAAFVNQTIHPQSSSALSSPISVSSHPVGQSGVGSSNNDELKVSKTAGMSTNLVNKVEPLNMVASLGPVTSTTMIPSAVPQARKASLARFLEKRKERALNSSPYNPNKKSAGCSNPDSIIAGSRATSIAGSSLLSTSNEMP
ncbi:protein TIFY 6B-like isoform X3 [Coffea eugenioides]|uniref:protein TIFY 6B-like isoform X3 n=1 Tax=Coffea eugenioides TaxID=49369 RepID=UPI000F6068B8|nr:protein TIFY 6B-like isoform X3 [Coffea eugenioides]